MDYKEIQNDNIQASLIKVQALQKEYEVTLQQYQEAGKNYINSLQNTSSNPCQNYQSDSTGISQACYEKIWADQGCTTTGMANASTDWAKSQTLDGLVNDSYLWATLTDDTHRQGCYGTSTTYTTNTSAIDPNSTDYAALPGRTWWGSAGVAEGTVDTQEECENMCDSANNCTGATFNPVKRYCWARTGDMGVLPGLDTDNALIPQQKAALIVMKSLNDKLLSINEQITTELKNSGPDVKQQYEQKNIQQQKLSDSYQVLLEQKIAMEKQLQEYYSIDEGSENQTLFVNQQTSSMKFWVLITCLVLLVTLNKLYGGSNPPIAIVLWLSIIIVLIILTYSLSSPAGFAMWFIVLLAIVLMKSGHLPSP